MYILGISSTTKTLSVALVKDNQVLTEFSVTGERAKAENITLFVKAVFNKAKLDIKKINAIAVTQGPGSYGGIRGGVTSAKSFAQVLNVPALGVSALEAMAYNFRRSGSTIMVILDAKRGELNLALFADAKEGLKRLTDDFVISASKLKKKIKKIEGEIIIAGPEAFPRGSNVAFIAAKKIQDTGLESFLPLIPKYSHQPNITKFSRKS